LRQSRIVAGELLADSQKIVQTLAPGKIVHLTGRNLDHQKPQDERGGLAEQFAGHVLLRFSTEM
jgi:hypothetical protein